MEYRELQTLNDDQLDSKLGELQEESFNLRFQFATRQLTNTARLREVRKDIARVKTEQRARELAAAAEG